VLDRLKVKIGPLLGFIIMAPAWCWLSRCILALTVIMKISSWVVISSMQVQAHIGVVDSDSRWCSHRISVMAGFLYDHLCVHGIGICLHRC
jgi:hypothetical protein